MVNQGDIYWVDLPLPFGSEPGYRRPCVVIQNNFYNQSRINTILMCVVTSNINLASAPGNVLLRTNEGSLPRASVVNVSQIVTIDRSRLIEYIGSISKRRVQEIVRGVKRVIEPEDYEETG